jgi:hypothetical protein
MQSLTALHVKFVEIDVSIIDGKKTELSHDAMFESFGAA